MMKTNRLWRIFVASMLVIALSPQFFSPVIFAVTAETIPPDSDPPRTAWNEEEPAEAASTTTEENIPEAFPTTESGASTNEASSSTNGIVVDPARSYQQFEGWGTSLCWWANAVGRWTGPKKQEIIDLLFDENTGLGLNIVRYNIGGGINPNELSKMRTHADIPSFQPEPGQWVLDADQYQREILQAALQKGVNITEAFSNGPPYWMTESKSAAGSVLGFTNNLYNDAYDDFANYVTRVLRQYKEEYGIEFRTYTPLNEPIDHWWIKGNNQEGCHFDRDKQNLILKEVASRLRENGLLNTRISANEEASFENAVKSFQAYDAFTQDQIAQINVHSYFGTDRKSLRKLTEQNGKRLWISECGVGSGPHNHEDISSCMELNRKILWDLKDLSANGWLYWQAVEDEAGKNNWGFIHASFTGAEDYWITKQFYTMKNYTKFIRPGSWIVQVDDNDTLAAYDPQRQRVVLVVTNDTSAATTKEFSLNGFSSTPNQISHTLRTSSTENAADVTAAQLNGKQLTVDLPAKSVTTIVLHDCIAPPVLKINDSREGILQNRYQYEGNWNQAAQAGAFDGDNHWSDDAQASYSIRFKGTRISLYGAKAPKHGIAEVWIDGAAVGTADLYAPQREEASCYFQSAVLSDNEHILTVKVTGDKHPEAVGTFVSADYALVEGELQTILPNVAHAALSSNSLVCGYPASLQGENQSLHELTDGRLDTEWNVAGTTQKRIIFPLYREAQLSEIQIFASDHMNLKIQTSLDGQTFADVNHHAPYSTFNGFWRVVFDSPTTAKFVAIECSPEQGKHYQIQEVKIFGNGYLDINDNTVGEQNMIMYQGNWEYFWFEKGAHLQDNHYSNTPNDSFRVNFNGTGVEVYGSKASSHGQAEVFLDGVSKGIIDYYSTNREDNVSMFLAENLAEGPHTLQVKVLNDTNPLSSDKFVTLDHIVIKTS